MRRTVLAVACVALLTVTAGCGGFLGGTDTTAREPYDVSPTPTAAWSLSETPSSGASAAFREAVENHTGALRRVGNFTVRRSQRIGRVAGNASPDPVETTMKVDFDAGRIAWGNVEDGAFVVRSYQNATGVYRRIRGGSGFRNATGTADVAPRDVLTYVVRGGATRPTTLPFERNGTATFDGERMARFTADDPGDFRGSTTQLRTVTGFHATALVDDRGIVRRFTYTLRGELYTGEPHVERETLTITDVGSTEVRPLAAIAGSVTTGAPERFRATVENHTEALRAAGNFTIRQTYASGRDANDTTPEEVTTGTAKVDFDAGRYVLGGFEGNGSGEFRGRFYQNATGVYGRDGAGFRNVTDANAIAPRRYATTTMRYAENRSVEFPFERSGTVRFDGEVMVRFTASDPGSFRGDFAEVRTVTEFRATVLLDDRGIVRRFSYTLRGELYSGDSYVETTTVEITDVGSTTVPWPRSANATDTSGGG